MKQRDSVEKTVRSSNPESKPKIKSNKKKERFLTPMTLDDLINDDYVFIHSYAENFNRHVYSTGLFKNIKDTINKQFFQFLIFSHPLKRFL